jgi:hypothetical protein
MYTLHMIYKGKGDKGKPVNYRGISFLTMGVLVFRLN